MNIQYAKSVIKTIKENPGITYDDLTKRFPDDKPGQLYNLLYSLCSPRRFVKGDPVSLVTKVEGERVDCRGIERGMFTLNEDYYSDRKLKKTLNFWQILDN